jgi:hypothetical protein
MKKINSNEMIQYQPLSSTFTGPPIQQDEISLNRKIRKSNNKKYFDSENESVDSFIARNPMPSVRPIRPRQQPYSYLYNSDNPPYNLTQDFNKEHIKEYQQNYQQVYQPIYREENKDLLKEKRSLKYQISKEDKMKQLGTFPDTISIINPIKENNEMFDMMIEEHDKFDKLNEEIAKTNKLNEDLNEAKKFNEELNKANKDTGKSTKKATGKATGKGTKKATGKK